MKLYKHKKLGKILVVEESVAHQLHSENVLAKPLGDSGQWVVRHNARTLAALDRLNIEGPPLSEGYDWPAKFDLYSHQKITAEFMAKHPRAWCTNGMRSGKTTSAGSASDLARSCRDLDADAKILILCPVNVMTTAWLREMMAIDRKKTYYVSKGSTAQVKKQMSGTGKAKGVNTLILNHDKLEWLAEAIDEWLGPDGLIIVDEAHAFRNSKTKRFQNLKFLADPTQKESKDRRLWLFTGTPVPNAPTDIYHLQKLIDATRVPATEGQWRSMTMSSFEMHVPVKPGSSRTRKLVKWQTLQVAEQLIADAMYPCIRFRTQDCVELPEQAYSYYECELSKDQNRMIKEMVAGYATTHEDKALIAANAGVRVSKILQVCTGTVLDNEGDPIVVGAPSKLKCLMDLYEQNEGKLLIFCTYKASQQYIKEELSKKKITAEIINGEVTATKREAIVDKFQSRSKPEVLILHPKCEGMTLTAATVSVWWGPPDSNLQWTQANERMRGPVKESDDPDAPKPKTLVAMLYGASLEKGRYVDRIESDVKQQRAIDIYAEALKEFGTEEALQALFDGDEDD